MSLNPSTSNEAALAVKFANCDDSKFRNIVYDFIERIANEISLFAVDSNEFDLSASAFRHIELQIQARRIEKALQICIAKIRLVFIVSQLIEYQCDHLKLFFQPPDVECIENFAKKWFESDLDPRNSDFIVDLNECLEAADRTETNFKGSTVIPVNFLLKTVQPIENVKFNFFSLLKTNRCAVVEKISS